MACLSLDLASSSEKIKKYVQIAWIPEKILFNFPLLCYTTNNHVNQ